MLLSKRMNPTAVSNGDLPAPLRALALPISRVCLALLCLSAVIQMTGLALDLLTLAGVSTGSFAPNAWMDLAINYATAFVLGLDATVTGVRAHADEGPSIRNVGPGGWSMLTAYVQIIALPAYLAGPRWRGARRPAQPDPPDVLTFMALAGNALLACTTLAFGWVTWGR